MNVARRCVLKYRIARGRGRHLCDVRGGRKDVHRHGHRGLLDRLDVEWEDSCEHDFYSFLDDGTKYCQRCYDDLDEKDE